MIFTVGHSNRGADEFVALLESCAVALVIDVRAYPRSRRNPQFDRKTLDTTLGAVGIDYVWHGKNLGGFRKVRGNSPNIALTEAGLRGFADHMQTAIFRQTMADVMGLCQSQTATLMCAEADHAHCHRQFIADYLTLAGVEVRHIRDTDSLRAHVLHPALNDGGRRPIYARQQQGDLFG